MYSAIQQSPLKPVKQQTLKEYNVKCEFERYKELNADQRAQYAVEETERAHENNVCAIAVGCLSLGMPLPEEIQKEKEAAQHEHPHEHHTTPRHHSEDNALTL